MSSLNAQKLTAKRYKLPLLLVALIIVVNATVLYHGSSVAHLPLTSFEHQVQLHLTVQAAPRHDAGLQSSLPHSNTNAHGSPITSDSAESSVASANGAHPGFDMRLQLDAWLSYAEADAARHGLQIPQQCNTSQGLEFLQRFKQSHGVLCGPNPASPTTQHTSSVECCAYPVNQRGLACWAANMVVNASLFMGMGVPKGEQQHDKYTPVGSAGAVHLDCHMEQPTDALTNPLKTIWQSGAGNNMHQESIPWFKSAAVAKDTTVQAHCNSASHVVQHPVMFVTRLDTTNPYHHTQSIIQAFLTLAVLNGTSKLTGLQVVIADHFETGPFIDIWQRLSDPYPVVSLSSTAFAAGLTCFQQSIHAHYVGPGKAFLGYEGIGVEHSCPSTVLMAAAHWQRYLFKEVLPATERKEYELLDKAAAKKAADGFNQSAVLAAQSGSRFTNTTPTQQQATVQVPAVAPVHRRLNVVWLSRSWFSRSMQAGGGLTGWQASRDLPAHQEAEIVKALEQAVLDWNSKACAPPVFGWWQKAHAVPPPSGCKPTNVSFNFRFAELSVEDLYPDQITLLTRTAVLVGVHGAALTNQIWMRPHRGAVVEFGAGGNFHYRNMAYELGHQHFRLGTGSPEGLVAAVKGAMDHVSSRY